MTSQNATFTQRKMNVNIELEDVPPRNHTVEFDLPADEGDSATESSASTKEHGRSLKRNLSRSMRGNMRSLSIHHLRNVRVEELAADIIQDIVGGDVDDVDSEDRSSSYQQFRYLESKNEIRCLTRPMQDKKKIMMLLENYESTQPTLNSNSLSLRSKMKWQRMWHKTSEDRQGLINPWFKTVEGKLGTGGSLFFRFILSAILLDLFVFCLSFFFLSLPQIALSRDSRHSDVTNSSGYRGNVPFSGRELVIGDGWLEETELYYGHYAHFPVDDSHKYDLRMAYFLVTCFVLLCSLLALCIMFSRAFKHSYYNTKGGISHVDANLIFSAWDFNVKEDKMASLCSKNVFVDLKILSAELQRLRQIFGLKDKVRNEVVKFGVEIIIVVMLVASPVIIYYACLKAGEELSSLSFKLGIPMLVTSLNSFLPKLFSELGKAENFRSSRTSSYLNVVRTSFLQVCNLSILVYYWFAHLACSVDGVKCSGVKCWETFVGSQLYALVILNMLTIVTITCIQLLIRYLHKIIGSKIKSKFVKSLLEAKEFNVGRTSIDVVYVQCLLWLSLYFSPLLSLLIVCKLLLIFGLKKLMARLGCYEPVKVWRLGHLETLVKLIHLVTFLLCLSVFLYTVVYVTPSSSCGPYKAYNRSYEVFGPSFSYGDSSTRDSFKDVVGDVVSSVGFRAFICLVFSILVYYLRVHSQGRHGVADQLKRQIELESKDRSYYLDALKLLKYHLKKPGEQMEALRKRRPGINHLVEGTKQQVGS